MMIRPLVFAVLSGLAIAVSTKTGFTLYGFATATGLASIIFAIEDKRL